MDAPNEVSSQALATLYKALLKAQPKIAAAIKDSKNPHFKSTYADINSVIEACKQHLNDVGILILQPVGFDPASGQMWVTTRLRHVESGEEIESKLPLVGVNDMQKIGSAITYARRYTLQSLVLMGAEDDDGNAASQQGRSSRPSVPVTVSHQAIEQVYSGQPEQKETLKEICKAKGIKGTDMPFIHDFCKGKPMSLLQNVVKAWKDEHYATK